MIHKTGDTSHADSLILTQSLTGYFPRHRIADMKGDPVRNRLFLCPDSALKSDEHENRL